MSAEKVVVDADLWEWLVDSARHDEGCSAAFGMYRCRCGFRDIGPRLDDAVPVTYDPVHRTYYEAQVTR